MDFEIQVTLFIKGSFQAQCSPPRNGSSWFVTLSDHVATKLLIVKYVTGRNQIFLHTLFKSRNREVDCLLLTYEYLRKENRIMKYTAFSKIAMHEERRHEEHDFFPYMHAKLGRQVSL
jgi:hypothetical protein